MTTKPKAKKFRIRRSSAASEIQTDLTEGAPAANTPRPAASVRPQPAQDHVTPRKLNPMEEAALEPHEDGFPDRKFATATDVGSNASAEEDILAIRNEGLTGRQLRMARRVAQKHGISANSDYDAVRQLRKAGIDPFQRAAMLDLVAPDGGDKNEEEVKLPQTVDKPKLPGPQVFDAADRAQAIMDIQMGIVQRRRRKLLMLVTRLAFFVLLPTILVGYYYHNIASPMYATKSEFIIQQADGAGGSGLGGLFAGSGLATSQDSITVQSYLSSRDAMLRLDQDFGFKQAFTADGIDSIQRMPENASNEEAYKTYKKNILIGYDPTEGIIRMEVVAPTASLSQKFSQALIGYAEARVDNLSQRLRNDQMKGSHETYEEAERDMLAAQDEVLRLQEELGVFDATTDASALMGQINGFEAQVREKTLSLQQLLDNPRPNKARVDGIRGDIKRLETLIAELRDELTVGGAEGSLASVSARLRVAQTNLETRVMLMQQSLQQLETARIEANKQTRYLELGVNPVAPDEPTYPRKFENTVLAFLIFSGIYLVLSLTFSVLREQVSA
ncbi:capsule biosynthesis protein [Aliiroseovarius sp. KMU-50]|uniref:Capsule biosynthesis protein n=1 Tax=Aliiroseovarius salicola TaxID=3009082 RepID=A0ABT4W1F8_9RHOB|nr:capsule biosynthesis protein [Aliiroseovarius sp. KMU-50]MDA5093662.1 capsule biosynthesis protein [Aliiroseovarius sp. KMU-50]